MPKLRLLFLAFVLLVTPGYRFRCYWFCIDQTGIQNDYVEQRDRCREYAQLKLDMAMRDTTTNSDKNRNAKLVSLFSDCMGNNGWTVPDGRSDTAGTPPPHIGPVPGPVPYQPAAIAAGPAVAPAAVAPVVLQPTPEEQLAQKYQEKASLSRASECAFARYSAATSSIAAARAKACDLECAQRLRAAPEAPRPAACPPEPETAFQTGNEREGEAALE